MLIKPLILFPTTGNIKLGRNINFCYYTFSPQGTFSQQFIPQQESIPFL
ncbi:hypothetical protein T4D_15466 [Trichinella pseudospiralis]|uniref:Uncharacterized protein n=1 Tax=Trichinella pseudospiralis TaxID=6337 RepID=A0A0V1DSE4_TRIPS|nr:hypothetical protein T4D_15466 [Trichinella pseudospiralis]